jgi:hypothetical protein
MGLYQDHTAQRASVTGEANHLWRGDEAGYFSMHTRVYRVRGKADHCEQCGLNDPDRVYHWANLTGNYADVLDYEMMCVSCHRKYDGAIAPGTNGIAPKGEQHGAHKLTEVTAREAYRRVIAGETRTAVARDLGMSITVISDLVLGKIWKHLGLEPHRGHSGRPRVEQ